jgi:Isochorismatase family
MALDAFSEQRIPVQPLALDRTRTAVIVVDTVNEFFEPGGKMVLAGGTVLYAPVNALLDAAHQAHIPVFYTNQWLRPDDALFKKRIAHCLMDTWGAQLVDALHRAPDDIVVPKRRVVYLYPAGNSDRPPIRYNPPFPTGVRGLCHASQPRFLPARTDRPGVGISHALLVVAIGARRRSTDTTHAHDATT